MLEPELMSQCPRVSWDPIKLWFICKRQRSTGVQSALGIQPGNAASRVLNIVRERIHTTSLFHQLHQVGIIPLELFILHPDSCWRCWHSSTCKNERLFLLHVSSKHLDLAALDFILSFKIIAFLSVVFQGGAESCYAFLFQGELGLLPL